MGLCVGREHTSLPLILALHLSCAFHGAQPAPTTGTPHTSHSYHVRPSCCTSGPQGRALCVFWGEEPHEVWRLQGLVQGESLCRVESKGQSSGHVSAHQWWRTREVFVYVNSILM